MKTKTCTRCGKDKTEDYFDLRPDRPGKRRSHCKECRRSEIRCQDAKNRERKKAYNEAYKEKNKDKISQLGKKRYQSKREEILSYCKSWRKSNPHKVAEGGKLRRSRLKKATPSWLTAEQQDQIKLTYLLRDDCIAISGDLYEVDHIVPITGKDICGLHVPWNLQVLPQDLNRSKNNHYGPESNSPRP